MVVQVCGFSDTARRWSRCAWSLRRIPDTTDRFTFEPASAGLHRVRPLAIGLQMAADASAFVHSLAMSSSRFFLGAAVVGGAVFVLWLVAGSRLVALIDRITTAPLGEPTTTARFSFDEGSDVTADGPRFTFDGRSRAAAKDWRAIERPPSGLTLEVPAGAIRLGTLTKTWTMRPDQHSYDFASAAGDVVTFTRRRSRLSWPRPFVINWLGGSASRWSRYVYDRLLWRRANGEVLEVVWRDEQRFFSSQGWMDQFLPAAPVRTAITRAPR